MDLWVFLVLEPENLLEPSNMPGSSAHIRLPFDAYCTA